MPGYKVCLLNDESFREGLKCSFCSLLLRDPIQTSETGQRYCKECYKEAVRLVLYQASLLHYTYSYVWLMQIHYFNSFYEVTSD